MKLLNNSVLYHIANLMLFAVLAVSIPNFVEYIIYQVTPFEFNVKVYDRTYLDVCHGSTTVTANIVRDVRPVTGVDAVRVTELVRFVDGKPRETEWSERKEYFYQDAKGIVEVDIKLPPNLPIGTYGLQEHITIKPMWGVMKSRTYHAEDYKFEIVDCN